MKRRSAILSRNYYEFSVSTTTLAVELISNIFIESGSKGVMIEDPSDFHLQGQDPLAWDYMEEEVFDFGHEDVRVIGYFSSEEDLNRILDSLLEKKSRVLEDKKAALRQFSAGERFTV